MIKRYLDNINTIIEDNRFNNKNLRDLLIYSFFDETSKKYFLTLNEKYIIDYPDRYDFSFTYGYTGYLFLLDEAYKLDMIKKGDFRKYIKN